MSIKFFCLLMKFASFYKLIFTLTSKKLFLIFNFHYLLSFSLYPA